MQKWQYILISGWKRCFWQTRALFWKKLKRVAPSAKMTKRAVETRELCWQSLISGVHSAKIIKRADLGLITLFCSLDKLVHFSEKSEKVVYPAQKWQYVVISGWKRCFGQTEVLCWKSLKGGAPSEKMTKRAALVLKTLFRKKSRTLLKKAKKCSPSAKMTKRADLRLKTLFYTNSCTFLKTLRRGVPRVKMTKHGDLGLKKLFCTNPCTLLKKAETCCSQCKNDKTCWSRANNAVLLFGQTRALFWKEWKSGVPSAKMTVRGDLGLKTLFWTNWGTLLKIAKRWCTQWENDKTCCSRAQNFVS